MGVKEEGDLGEIAGKYRWKANSDLVGNQEALRFTVENIL